MPTTGRNSSSTSTPNLMIYSYMTGSVEISERLGDRQDHITMKACISSSMRPLVISFALKVSNTATTANDFSTIQFPRTEKDGRHQRQVIIQGIAPIHTAGTLKTHSITTTTGVARHATLSFYCIDCCCTSL